MAYPLWNYYPRNVRPPEWVNGLVATVAAVSGTISTVEQRTGLSSDDVLRELTPGLTSLGYVVESGKSRGCVEAQVLYIGKANAGAARRRGLSKRLDGLEGNHVTVFA